MEPNILVVQPRQGMTGLEIASELADVAAQTNRTVVAIVAITMMAEPGESSKVVIDNAIKTLTTASCG